MVKVVLVGWMDVLVGLVLVGWMDEEGVDLAANFLVLIRISPKFFSIFLVGFLINVSDVLLSDSTRRLTSLAFVPHCGRQSFRHFSFSSLSVKPSKTL